MRIFISSYHRLSHTYVYICIYLYNYLYNCLPPFKKVVRKERKQEHNFPHKILSSVYYRGNLYVYQQLTMACVSGISGIFSPQLKQVSGLGGGIRNEARGEKKWQQEKEHSLGRGNRAAVIYQRETHS